MPRVRYSVTINRPVDKVFQFVTNLENASKWQPDVVQVYHAEESLRIGMIISQDRSTRLLHWRLDLNADIMEYRPNKLVEYVGALGQFPVRGRLEFDGTTRATTVSESLHIRMGIRLAIFAPFMKTVMQRRTRRTLKMLKTVLETESPNPAIKPVL